MKNMSYTTEEIKERDKRYEESPSSIDGPKYPYGLRVSLGEETMKKLKLASLPKVGSAMLLLAKVEVCMVSQYDSVDGGNSANIELQITDMELTAPDGKDVADQIYGES